MEMAGTTIKEALREHAMELAEQAWPTRPAAPLWATALDDRGVWYIVETEPQREGIATAHMLGRGFAPYLPQVLQKGVRAGRSLRDVTRPMFRGYLFLKMHFDRDFYRIRNLPGVRGLLRKAGSSHTDPLLLYAHPNDHDIAFIRAQEKEALDPGAAKRSRMAPFSPGRLVRIKDGPFGGFTGRVWQLAEHERITILLDVFARSTPVQFTPDKLEPL